jgi:predicted RND superfamily exporter protein
VQAVAPEATGVPVSVTEAGNVILRAFAKAIAYTLIAIAVVLVVLRRRISDVLLVLAPPAVASVWTVAASAVLDLPFNFANVIVIPLLIGLGVASSVHMVVRARELAHGASSRTPELMGTSTPRAVLIAQLNSVGAFATLAVSAHRGLYSMGLLLGLAILFVLIASLIVLPAVMSALGRPGSQPPVDGGAT